MPTPKSIRSQSAPAIQIVTLVPSKNQDYLVSDKPNKNGQYELVHKSEFVAKRT